MFLWVTHHFFATTKYSGRLVTDHAEITTQVSLAQTRLNYSEISEVPISVAARGVESLREPHAQVKNCLWFLLGDLSEEVNFHWRLHWRL